MAVRRHEVLLFGGSGAGKTTLLASMWEVSNRLFLGGKSHLEVVPDDASSVFLTRAARALKEAFIAGDLEGDFVKVERTATEAGYELYVARRERETPMLELRFVDTPGGWSTEKTPKLTPYFEESPVAILAVDAVELFEAHRAVAIDDRRNNPELTQLLIKRWLRAQPDGKLLLCVVPLKTETLLRRREGNSPQEGGARLHERLRADYRDMFDELRPHQERAAVIICPVQTVGNLVFAGYEPAPDGGYPEERWRRIAADDSEDQPPTGYAPLDSDQPLRHILNWAVIDQIEQGRKQRRGLATRLFEWMLSDEEDREAFDWLRNQFLDVFGQDTDLVRAVSAFARDTKTDPPFEIVQGEALVRRVSEVWDRVGG